MRLWDHSPSELLILPVPDLALLVLDDFISHDGWNMRNWMMVAQQNNASHFGSPDLQDRLAEAWAWLDARVFVSRRFDQTAPDARKVTSEGRRALAEGMPRLHASVRLQIELSPELQKAQRQFLQGDYEEAVFAAFRTVEEVVRAESGASSADLGVRLMREAFKPGLGNLADKNAETAEQEAVAALFAGAIGIFKNPSSHRTVDYDDPILAADAVLLADLLIRLVRRMQR